MSSVTHSLPLDTTLPPEIVDASAWYGPDLKQRADWIERFTIVLGGIGLGMSLLLIGLYWGFVSRRLVEPGR